MSDNTADKLKNEGNALFAQGKYGTAALKYTEAIELDESNAILYANRAQCRLKLEMYLDAANDATKAVDLNPAYPKAWARLATAHDALGSYDRSSTQWRRALDALPGANLTPSEQMQKGEYEAKLKAAEANLKDALEKLRTPAPHVALLDGNEEPPWVVGRRLVQGYETARIHSSAFIITEAYVMFKQGLDLTNSMKQWTDPQTGQLLSEPKLGAIEMITNGILLDRRAAHDEGRFMELLSIQLNHECNTFGAWPSDGPDAIMRELPGRIARDGWPRTQTALSMTLRAWILRGWLGGINGLGGGHHAEVKFISGALQVLVWARETYKDFPTSEKGDILADAFVMLVRRALLDALLAAYKEKPSQDILEDLLEEAEEVMNAASKLDPPRPTDGHGIGPFIGSYMYPQALAMAAIGFYHVKQAALATSEADARDHWKKAAVNYKHASEELPPDDEIYVWYLHQTLEYMHKAGAPEAAQLPIFNSVRESVPKAKELWHASATSKEGMIDLYNMYIDEEAKYRQQGQVA